MKREEFEEGLKESAKVAKEFGNEAAIMALLGHISFILFDINEKLESGFQPVEKEEK